MGASVPLIMAVLYRMGRVEKRHLWLLLWGFGVGATWEFANYFAGESYHAVLVEWPMPLITLNLWHTFWDAGLFMIGYALCVVLWGEAACTQFRWGELGVMWVWGVGQEFVVELLGNGVIWEYRVHPWNPVWITIGGRDYTLLPQLIWAVAPVVFYLGAVRLLRRAKPVAERV